MIKVMDTHMSICSLSAVVITGEGKRHCWWGFLLYTSDTLESYADKIGGWKGALPAPSCQPNTYFQLFPLGLLNPSS